jgi:SAM-dependent methyltransferase
MSMIFSKEYSDVYDDLYKEKDYDGECELIVNCIHNYSKIPFNLVKSILDMGCGTGNHAIRLAEEGYEVTGVDVSDEMLNIAVSKTYYKDLPLDFIQSDIRTFNDGKKYDVIIMMFAVLGYQQSNEDVIAALKTVSKHLKEGGIFVCDLWYGPAVLSQKPGDKVRTIESGDNQIIRQSSGIIDMLNHRVKVHLHVWKIHQNIITEKEEDHNMRFFFPQELKLLFESAGLDILDMRGFPDMEKKPSEQTWNICVVGSQKVNNV